MKVFKFCHRFSQIEILNVHRAVFFSRRGYGAVDMVFDGDEVGSGGGEVAFIVYLFAANYPAHSFCFGFLGAIGAYYSNASCLFFGIEWCGIKNIVLDPCGILVSTPCANLPYFVYIFNVPLLSFASF